MSREHNNYVVKRKFLGKTKNVVILCRNNLKSEDFKRTEEGFRCDEQMQR